MTERTHAIRNSCLLTAVIRETDSHVRFAVYAKKDETLSCGITPCQGTKIQTARVIKDGREYLPLRSATCGSL